MMPGMKPPMSPSSSPMGQQSPMQDQSEQENDPKAGKLMALQNLLGSIADISDDELRPYIEKAQQQIQMAHEQDETPEDESAEHSSDESDMGAPGPDIAIKVGASPGDSEDEDEGKPKGFLAILAKRAAQK